MSQFTLTQEEDALVVTALQYLSEVQTASHGGATDEVKALLAKIQPAQEVAIEAAVVAEEAVAEVEEVEEVAAEEVAAEDEAE